MKHLLSILLLCWSWSAWAQPLQRNAATTNAGAPKLPNLLPSTTSPLFPVMVENPDGSGGDRTISYIPGFTLTVTNLTVPGSLLLNGRTNRLSIANDKLLLDGAPLASTTVTNTEINSVTLNVTTQNFHLAKGSTLVITQVAHFAWSTLTMSGSNVSAVNLTNSTLFKLRLTNDAFMVAPINFPGTNFGGTYQVHVEQDGTGGRSLTLTNSSWRLSGQGASTNQVAAITTNANAVSVLTFATSPFSSSLLYGVTTPF